MLACKAPVTASEDEDGFIAVHQICELAFHQMLLDLPRALAALEVGFPSTATVSQLPALPCAALEDALYFLRRVNRFWRTVNATLPILGDLRAFVEFREALGPTSGFQSAQFRRLELLSGVPAYWHGGTADEAGTLHVAETAFEARYGADLEALAAEVSGRSLRRSLRGAPAPGLGSGPLRAGVALLCAGSGAIALPRILLSCAQLRFHHSRRVTSPSPNPSWLGWGCTREPVARLLAT